MASIVIRNAKAIVTVDDGDRPSDPEGLPEARTG